MSVNNILRIAPRRSADRGHGDHGWLKTYHTFSFADYTDPSFTSFGALRVINEDRVAPTHGFPMHPHSRFEIWSYIISGSLGHKDSMGNMESLSVGDLQLTYAGSGIRHSEYSDQPSDGETTHFLQIWAMPPKNRQAGEPRYYTRRFERRDKLGALCKIVEGGKSGLEKGEEALEGRDERAKPAPLMANVDMWASILNQRQAVTHTFKRNKGYVHLAMKSGYASPRDSVKSSGAVIKVGDVELKEGDGAFLEGVEGKEVTIEATGEVEAEFVLFDLE